MLIPRSKTCAVDGVNDCVLRVSTSFVVCVVVNVIQQGLILINQQQIANSPAHPDNITIKQFIMDNIPNCNRFAAVWLLPECTKVKLSTKISQLVNFNWFVSFNQQQKPPSISTCFYFVFPIMLCFQIPI